MKRCQYCGTQMPVNFTTCHKCGQHPTDQHAPHRPPDYDSGRKPSNELSGLSATGVFLFLFSMPAVVYFLMFFDPSVGTEYGRVNNLGLMQERQNWLIVSGLAVLISVICMVSGRKKG